MLETQKYLILTLFLSLFAFSQEDRDTRGRDFWLTFMPNVHIASTNDEVNFLSERDSLYIFVASDFPTTVVIDYKDQNGIEYSETIEIEDVLEYSTFKVAWFGFELPDSYTGISEQIFHITSDEDITVIAHNQSKWSSDGMIVYPTKTLGNHYFVNSYPSYRNAGLGVRSSQFAVVALEDQTTIEINSNADILDWNDLSRTITLDRGQAYLAQADLPLGTINGGDLTGSEIKSDKPISVFSGNERAYVPLSERGSKDYLTAQMIPVESMGRKYHLLPFVSVPEDELSNFPDYYRVVGVHDGTEIYVDGQFVDLVNKGESFTGGISDRGLFLETSKSSSVYQIKRSTNDGFNDQISAIGDPFMLLNIPETQYKESYKVINFQSNEFTGFNNVGNPTFREVYQEQYINIAIQEDFTNSIFFDFAPLVNLGININWRPIPSSEYVWARIPVEIGTHTITANIPFICYAYGYGPANSYGFVCGGINMKLLDHNPPEISSSNINCGSYEAEVSDLNYLDSGVDRIEITSSSNVDINFDNTGDSLGTRNYSVILQDEFNDGYAVVTSYDEFGMWVRDTIAVPGFTVALTNTSENAIIETPEEFQIGSSNTYNFEILNYGDFNVQINEILKNEKLEIFSPATPFKIAPGQVLELVVGYTNSGDLDIIKDDISLVGICSERSIIAVDIETWIDENPPEITSLDFQECNPDFKKGYTVSITDEGLLESGLQSVDIFQQNNVIIQEIENNDQRYIAQIFLEDPFQSGYVFYIARDVFGNVNDEISFFIEPIDLQLSIEQDQIDIGSVLNGFVKCKEFTLYNDSDFEIEINNLNLNENINFSVPQSQFPIYLSSGDSVKIQVCFDDNGDGVGESIDIADLVLEDCLIRELELKALIFDYRSEGNSRCDLDLQFSLDQVPPDNFLENPRPNPTNTTSKIFIGLHNQANVSIRVFNFFGVSYGSLLDKRLQAGLFELNIDGSDLESGQYHLVVEIEDEVFVEKLVIQK